MIEETQAEPAKVLIVGSDDDATDDLDARLAAAGLQVVRVSDLEGVERAFRASRPDSGILDLGAAIDERLVGSLERLREDADLRHVPLIALVPEENDLELEPLDVSMTERLKKPVQFENLLARVRANVEVKRRPDGLELPVVRYRRSIDQVEE